MSMRMTDLSGITAQEMDELKRRQAERLRSDIAIRPAPPSRRARNSQNWTAEQIERLRLQLLNMFR
jgi:hypothetical protein